MNITPYILFGKQFYVIETASDLEKMMGYLKNQCGLSAGMMTNNEEERE